MKPNMHDQTPHSSSSQTLWTQLVADYRQACLLTREGRAEEARGIVNEKLPQKIALWSREDTRSAAEKRSALEVMFSSEQISMDSWFFSHQALTNRLAQTLIPAIRQQISQEMREAFAHHPLDRMSNSVSGTSKPERIRFDDIPAMIDSLLAQQAADYGPRPEFAY